MKPGTSSQNDIDEDSDELKEENATAKSSANETPAVTVVRRRSSELKSEDKLEFIKECIKAKKQLKIVVKVSSRTEKSKKDDKSQVEQTTDVAKAVSDENLSDGSRTLVVDGFPCSEEGCTAVLRSTTALRKHKKVHAPKRFDCKECNKTFAELTKLRRHMVVHTGEKPHKCAYEECGRSFALESNLKTHQKTHTGEKIHVCPQCSRRFAHSYNLKVHVLRRHSSDSSN